MKIEKVIARLEREFPAQMALGWDNPGLQVGHEDYAVKKVVVALDPTEEVIRSCIEAGAELLVTHHPLLLAGIHRVTAAEYPARKVLTLAENRIAHFAMHTNYDVIRMTELAEQALRLKKTKILEVTGIRDDGSVYGIGSVGNLPKRMSAKDCCAYVKEAFGLKQVRLFGDPKAEVKTIAVSPGSGKSMIHPALEAGAELFVTGDIGHHEGLDAAEQGMPVIDAGHFGTEHFFVRQVADFLRAEFPELKVKEAKEQEPFTVL